MITNRIDHFILYILNYNVQKVYVGKQTSLRATTKKFLLSYCFGLTPSQ